MNTEGIPGPAVRRLSLYLRQLENIQRRNQRTTSSRQLGEALGLTDAQVRKDLAYFGQFGHPGIGYHVDELINQVRKILGTDKDWNVILVGAGNLGRALSAYRGFARKGFRLVAIFDADETKVGTVVGNLAVQSLNSLQQVVRVHQVKLGIISVPAEAAQQVAEQLAGAGIKGVLNFAPISLLLDDNVAISAVDLAVHLEQLSFQVSLADG